MAGMMKRGISLKQACKKRTCILACPFSDLNKSGTSLAYPKRGKGLFVLMTILAQTFLAFVRGHLMSFTLLSAGHFI